MAQEIQQGVDLPDRLKEISKLIYGDKAELRMVDPRSVQLLKTNARFMKKPMFDQLQANVQKDGMLSSVPLMHEYPDGHLEVISGNHRVKAAIKAELGAILALVLPYQETSEKIAKQISHNSIAGEDDKQVLLQLWKEIEDIEMKIYSGLDSETVAELEKIDFSGFTAEQIRSKKLVFWFLPEEVDDFDQLLDESMDIASSDEVYMAAIGSYQKIFDSLVQVKKFRNIKNSAVALLWLIDQMPGIVEKLKQELEEIRKAEEDGSGEGSDEPAVEAED